MQKFLISKPAISRIYRCCLSRQISIEGDAEPFITLMPVKTTPSFETFPEKLYGCFKIDKELQQMAAGTDGNNILMNLSELKPTLI